MGVFGLLTQCMQNKDRCTQYVDLLEIARQKGGIEILVDYYAFQQLLSCKMEKSLSALSGNDFIPITGGEYNLFDGYLTKLVKDLQSLNIHLVLFLDGARGSSQSGVKQKFKTWKQRHFTNLRRLHDLLDVCYGQKEMCDLHEHCSIRPVLLDIQCLETLKDCGCEVVQCVAGEADIVLAKSLQERPKAYAVLSNDSDFCVLKDCVFIPMDLFDLNNDLHLGEAQPYPEKPIRLTVGVIRNNGIISLLGLKDHQQLIEVGIMAGNDYTTPFVKGRLKGELGIHGKDIMLAANFVIQCGQIENNRLVAQELAKNPDFRYAVQHSRDLYSMRIQPDEPHFKGYFSKLINEGIKQNVYPVNIMAMHQNFYWRKTLIEDAGYGVPCVEVALEELRKLFYHIIMNKQDNRVKEFGRSQWEEFGTRVVPASDDRTIPCIHHIQKENIFRNLRVFNQIMMHQEPYFDINFIEKYGRRNGFLCILLRYFLVLNSGNNLCVNLDEFLALIAAVFGKVDDVQWYIQLCFRPNARCITLANWLQDIYRHAYHFIGKLLFLTDEFPQPKDIFSGVVWTAFYYVSTNAVPNSFLREIKNRIWQEMDAILKEKRYLVRSMTKGIFDYVP